MLYKDKESTNDSTNVWLYCCSHERVPPIDLSGQLLVLIILLLAITSITQGGWAPQPVCTFCRNIFCLCSEWNPHFIVFSQYLLTFCCTVFFFVCKRGDSRKGWKLPHTTSMLSLHRKRWSYPCAHYKQKSGTGNMIPLITFSTRGGWVASFTSLVL